MDCGRGVGLSSWLSFRDTCPLVCLGVLLLSDPSPAGGREPAMGPLHFHLESGSLHRQKYLESQVGVTPAGCKGVTSGLGPCLEQTVRVPGVGVVVATGGCVSRKWGSPQEEGVSRLWG